MPPQSTSYARSSRVSTSFPLVASSGPSASAFIVRFQSRGGDPRAQLGPEAELHCAREERTCTMQMDKQRALCARVVVLVLVCVGSEPCPCSWAFLLCVILLRALGLTHALKLRQNLSRHTGPVARASIKFGPNFSKDNHRPLALTSGQQWPFPRSQSPTHSLRGGHSGPSIRIQLGPLAFGHQPSALGQISTRDFSRKLSDWIGRIFTRVRRVRLHFKL